ncbi:thiamine pyrophosphate-requiring protein [Ramlibacter humi]|uniref:Thiamine pyrophosphate-requiring protein n=1 Tax=Ramlibacter humi TaxID=2530451 RepID=A0A4Z0BD06_9BURK|nr:thiamine pyrophosphate-requiring protein [Ramlibacter humi]TFY97175.1 thiamine pyrophosphate-requiring protein [Ramlibacter humi]
MTTDAKTPSVARRYLARMREHGIKYLFGNAGTDFPPLIEALAEGDCGIQPILVPHENVVVGMAYGAALASGRPQLLMVHVGLGTANTLCGLLNATRQHVPLVLTAGRTPVLEHGRLGARNNHINWAQEMFDQAGMVREMVKWEYELRDPDQVESVVDRALAMAGSAPQGPVYLVLPREVLAAPAPAVDNEGIGRQAPVRAGLPPADDLASAAQWLAQARRPLIITADAGRTAAGFEALTALAEQCGIPVVQYRPRYLNLPSSSRAHAGYDPHSLLGVADLVLAVDVDVPWIPGQAAPAPGARVIQAGLDPLCAGYPMRGFRSDLTLQGDTAAILRELLKLRAAHPPSQPGWLSDATSQHRRSIGAPIAETLNNRYVSRCIAKALGPDGVLVNEYIFSLEEMDHDTPGRYFAYSPAGGLGWGMGAAMGIRLERPDALVMAVVGDGTYMFGNPTPTHFTSAAHGLPFVTVVFNNRRWGAVHRATLSMYGQGAAARAEKPVFATLEPTPDYERIVEAAGGLGIRVETAAELPKALERAVHAVRHERRQAVVNIIADIGYERTS